jgi:hypothetical protein
MKAMMAALLATGWMGGTAAAQDVAGLIERLGSKDKDEVEAAQDELLKAGESALLPLRDAASKSADSTFKKRAGFVADRLVTRKATSGLALSWGDRWYAIYINALKTGWVHLKSEAKDGKLVFTDELVLQPTKTQTITIKAALTCEPNEYLSPLSVSLDTSGGDDAASFEGKVKEGRMVLSSQGQKQALKLNSNTVVDFAFLRLVTILPSTPEYPLSLIELMKPEIKGGAVAKFETEETIEHDGRKVKARRFILSDGVGEDRFYWVGAAGQLYKLQAKENIEAVLSDEKRAKDLDTKD